MTQQTKAELIKHYRKEYKRATKKGKSEILNHLIDLTGYTRKHLIHALNQNLDIPRKITRKRSSPYEQVIDPLEKIWVASNFLCGRRLAPFLPDMIESLKRHREIKLTKDDEVLLKKISASTIDRLLSPIRKKFCLKGRSTTKPGTLLKHQIPVRTFTEWDDAIPGFLQIDLVAHCGDTLRGEYINTLDMTDVSTGWTVCAAFMGKSDRFCSQAIDEIRPTIPFSILGIDSDNGSEFINKQFMRYCERNSITFTRGRAWNKNDSCYIEQKNWDVVRKMIGYRRLDTYEQLDTLKRIYNLLALYQNYFQPSCKLLSKTRSGAKVKKTYDSAQTPAQRLIARTDTPEETKKMLKLTFMELNPAYLLRTIHELLEKLHGI